ncbi:MAG: helix-turn-helix domain-containing protein [Heteroscytonema crispum UTEX LB 1556]
MTSTNEHFAQAANYWDLETLYIDLASVKGKRLTPVEKLHLRGLLCGYSPVEIAQKLNKSAKGVGVDLCKTLYVYVKNLVDKSDKNVKNWRDITEWLEEGGYKNQPSFESDNVDDLPLKILVNKANISLENNRLIIDFNLRIVASSSL